MNFYFEAAKVLDKLDAKQGSIKGLIASLPESNRKRSTALIIETLKYKPILSDVINAAKLMKEERKLNSFNLALILVHDLLLGKGIQAGDGPIKQAILRHKTRMNGEFQKLKIKRGVTSNAQLAASADARAATIPRYVRVNTALWTTDEAVQYYLSRNFTLSPPLESSKGFACDPHIPNLLCFAPQSSFAEDPAYLDGRVIIQDKASCFPAFVLAPPAGDDSVVIDATAAPGNKTSHLSALMRGKGKLYAFERDTKRYGTLQKMLKTAKCHNAIPTNADFTTIDPNDEKFGKATHILLDPSCSGSGIVNRLDHLIPTAVEEDEIVNDRLTKLAGFQLKMIQHAMKFPHVQKIVYSTCSIHATENEHVVRAALETEEAKAGPFALAPRNEVIPTWSRRGLPEELPDGAHESVIRCSPDEDHTNGFFVSCFVRVTNKRKLDVDCEEEVPQTEKARKNKKRKKRK